MSSVSAVNSLLSSTNATPGQGSTIDISKLLQAAAGASTAGIDVNAAVEAAIYAARAPERQWQEQQSALQDKSTALVQMQAAVSSLSGDMESLSSVVGALSSRAVTSTYSNVVTGSATAGAQVGNHVVIVDHLAATASWYSELAKTSSTPLGTDTFRITMADGTSLPIALGNGVNTLDDLATYINHQALGVTANVVHDSIGARLALVSNSPGADADFSIAFEPTTTSSWRSASVASSDTALAAGAFSVDVGTTTTVLSVTAGETLDGLAGAINANGLGITASVINDSDGAHLVIVSDDPNSNFSISNDPAFRFTQAVAGTNASLTVDGIPISSATNTVKGAVPGLTLNLLNASFGAEVNLSIAPDQSQVSMAIVKFVTDYNTAIAKVNSQFVYNGRSQGPLAGDAAVRMLQGALMQAVAYRYTPPPGASAAIASLRELGISMNNDGTVTLDNTTLSSALQNSFDDVQGFFQGTGSSGFATFLHDQLNNFLDPSNGAFTVDIKSTNAATTDLQNHIDDFESNYVSGLQARLRSQYSQAEIALQQLPAQMALIQAQLGNSPAGSK